MKICLLNTSDGRGGGYAAIYRLHKNLKAAGHDTKLIVAYKQTSDPDVIQSNPFHFYSSRLLRLVNERIFKLRNRTKVEHKYYFDFSGILFQSSAQILNKVPFKPDLFVASWINGFLSPKQLYDLNMLTGSPIVWYLMDMAPFTGGCHYSWDCVGYLSKCGKCPALCSNDGSDLSRKNWIKKNRYIQKTNLTIVVPTHWLEKQASEATLFNKKKIEKIMLGVDSEIFKPEPRSEARKKLGITNGKKIIFFGATALNESRKGMNYLLSALDILKNNKGVKDRKIMAVTMGDASEISSSLEDVFESKHLRYIDDDKLLATAYQAADLFVCPSIEDSGPMMVNEAVMCGTPVVSYEMGVAPDLVHTGITGYRAELKNSSDLSRGMKYILELSADEAKIMSERCREFGLRCCHPKSQSEAFRTLFDTLLYRKQHA